MLSFRPFLIPGLVSETALRSETVVAVPSFWTPPSQEPTASVFIHAGGGIERPKTRPTLLASSDRAPSDHGALRIDCYRWQLENKKTENDGFLMRLLSGKIREALWSEINRPEPSVAGRAIAKSDKIGVRINKTGEGLKDYRVDLFATPPPYMNVDQVQWTLNLSEGSMEPIPYIGHEVLEWGAQRDVSLDFGPYYRKTRFRSGALSAAPLLKLLSPERLAAIHRASTPRPPALPVAKPLRIPSAPKAPEQPSALVRAYPVVHEAVMNQLATYCDWKKLPPPARLYLFRLTKAILGKLYQRETEDASISSLGIVHVWIRNYRVEPSDQNVEVDVPTNFLGKTIGPDDILLALVRNDPKNPEVYGHMEHQRTHFDSDADNADFRFTQSLGIWPAKLHIRWDALHLSFNS